MANDISLVLKTTYAKEMQLIAQQLDSRIVSRTNVVTNVGGIAYRPQLLDLDAVETASAPARGVDHANLEKSHREVIISLVEQYSPTYLRKHEMLAFSGSASIRQKYATSQLANINRWRDNVALTALGALNTPLAAPTSNDALGGGNFTYNKFLEALSRLETLEYTVGQGVTCLINASGIRDLRTFVEIKSTDFDKINQIQMGVPTELWGVTFILTNLLKSGTGIINTALTTRKMYMFSDMAVESAYVESDTPETVLSYIEEKTQYLVNAGIDGFGSGVTFVGGVVEIENEEVAIT